jgi:hypothetical protein
MMCAELLEGRISEWLIVERLIVERLIAEALIGCISSRSHSRFSVSAPLDRELPLIRGLKSITRCLVRISQSITFIPSAFLSNLLLQNLGFHIFRELKF